MDLCNVKVIYIKNNFKEDNSTSYYAELVEDMISVITSFSSKMYSMRANQNFVKDREIAKHPRQLP